MTSRERVIATIEGREVDKQPVLAWPATDVSADFEIQALGQRFTSQDKIKLSLIPNPFGHALAQGHSLSDLMRTDIQAGERLLGEAAEEVRQDISAAMKGGAEGIVYLLYGAEMTQSTPMEYGGHFLEVDRAILNDAAPALRMVFVVGGEDAFLDFVSDLPAEIFSWDVLGTGVSIAQIQEMRQGALAAASEDANIFLSYPGDISPKIQIQQLANV